MEVVKNIKDNNIIEDSMTISQWWSYFDTISVPLQKGSKWKSLLIILLILLTFFLFFINIIFSIISFIVIIFLLKSKPTMKPSQIKVNKMVLPFLIYLKDHVQPDVNVELILDLSDGMDNKFLKGTVKEGYNVFTTYEQSWLRGNTILNDGTKIVFSFKDILISKKKGKYNPRGKYKTKTKFCFKTKYKVNIGFDSKRYSVPSIAFSKDKDSKRRFLKIKGAQKYKSYTAGSPCFDPGAFSNCLWNAYKQVKSA